MPIRSRSDSSSSGDTSDESQNGRPPCKRPRTTCSSTTSASESETLEGNWNSEPESAVQHSDSDCDSEEYDGDENSSKESSDSPPRRHRMGLKIDVQARAMSSSSEAPEHDSAYSSQSEELVYMRADPKADPEENTLLGHVDLQSRDASDHEVKTAPLFTREAYEAAGAEKRFPQRGVMGTILGVGEQPGLEGEVPHDPRLYVNTNVPFSALVCGVQGSGKSHTISVLLENMLIPGHRPTGALQKPLSALVLHFGETGALAQPTEAAWVTVAKAVALNTPKIKVFVSKSALKTMTAIYSKLGSNIKVVPLRFGQAELDAQAFLSMMAVGQSGAPPLYMSSLMSILHSLGEDYSYSKFKVKLEEHKKKLNPQQLCGLEQRMDLLESFLDKANMKTSRSSRFAAGQLTVVDLSDPFLDPAQACAFFEIVTRLFLRADVGTGKVLVLDEAHKYLGHGTAFARSIMSLIRQQRHLAMRVIISTQEPTVVLPVLLDLCSICILHRFSSPCWWEHVAKHVSAEMSSTEAFDRIVRLQTGQAIVLAPSGLGTFVEDGSAEKVLGQFGRKWLLVKTRQRVTQDGGASLMVVDT